MKKVILHIGCEKTGTTSIQNFLAANRERLLSKHGLLVPRSLGETNHTKFAIYACDESRGLTRFLKQGEKLAGFRERLRRDFIGEVESFQWNTLVISAEWLHPRVRDDQEFSRIVTILQAMADDIEVLMYVRRQDELALSLYSTSLKAGSYHHFEFPSVRADKLPYYYNFYAVYKNWARWFGSSSVKVRVFDVGLMCQGSVVCDFLESVGVMEKVQVAEKKANKSLTNEGVYLYRAFNYWLAGPGKEELSKEKEREMRRAIESAFEGGNDLIASSEKVEFYKRFSQSNSDLRRAYYINRGEGLEGIG